MSGLAAKDSAIRLSPEQEAEFIKLTSPEEMKSFMRDRAIEQALVTQVDPWHPEVLEATPLAFARPNRVAKTVTVNVNGSPKKYVLEADDELGLEKAEGELMRGLMAERPNADAEAQARDEQGRFTKIDRQMAEIELAARLEPLGLTVADLQDVVADKQSAKFEKSWEQATEEFRTNNPNFPGGDANRETIARLIQENDLVDSPSAETLQRVYDFMLERGLVSVNPDVQYQREMAAATTKEQIDLVNSKFFPGSGVPLQR